MVDDEQKVDITFEPVLVPQDQIIIPLRKIPTPPTLPPTPIPRVTEKKNLIFNIETTGLKPWEHRIISIGYQDPTQPDQPPSIIMLEDEKLMLQAFLTVLQESEISEIVGYGLSFDYRFILIRCMFYNIPLKEFYDLKLYDLMQAMAQGKFAFVYFPQKPPKLSELADFLWQYPKPFSDTEMIKLYISGDLGPVREFASSQITRILALYLLFGDLSTSPITPLGVGNVSRSNSNLFPNILPSETLLTFPGANSPETRTIKCNECLAEFMVPTTESLEICTICGTRL